MEPSNASMLLLGCLGLLCLGVVLIAGLFALGVRLSYSTRKRMDQVWVDAAHQLGLAYTSQTLEEIKRQDRIENPSPAGLRRFIRVSSAPVVPLPGMEGNYHGLSVRIDTHESIFGLDEPTSSDRFTRLVASVSNPNQVMLEMRTGRMASPYANMKAERCQSGVEAIDERFNIRCHPADFVGQWMPGLASYLAAIPGRYEVRLEGDTLIISILGLLLKPEVFRAALDLAVELDRAMGS